MTNQVWRYNWYNCNVNSNWPECILYSEQIKFDVKIDKFIHMRRVNIATKTEDCEFDIDEHFKDQALSS